jgi:hypothetical protein
MSFDWSKYLVLAEELPIAKSAAGMEALLRTAVSRGYYGAFHRVRQQLQLHDSTIRFSAEAAVHQEVTQRLRTSSNRQWRQLGLALGRLRQYRNNADYQDVIQNVATWHALAVGTLAQVTHLLEGL